MTIALEAVQAAYEKEHAANREAITADDLPLSFEAITDRWLTAVLCAGTPGAEVESHSLSAPDNGSSNRRKIYLHYNAAGRAAGLPETLFCKATHGLANRFALGVSGAARAEVIFYNHIRPLLRIEAPVGRFASHHDDTLNSMVMLDDLSGSVQSFCDHKTVMTRQRAESQIRLLAEFHGRCYSDAALRENMAGLSTWQDFFRNTLKFGMAEGANAGFIAGEEVIPERLYRRASEFWPAVVAAVDKSHELPHTLMHGDVHLKNWYIAGSGEMGLSDWQCASRGHWGRDLAYTLGTALTVEDRREWERDLLKLYLEELARHGGATTDFSTAWDIYRRQIPPALTWWTVTLCPAPGMPDMQPRDTTLEFVRRLSTALDDLDGLDA